MLSTRCAASQIIFIILIITSCLISPSGSVSSLTPPELLHVHGIHLELVTPLLHLAKVHGAARVLRLCALAPVVLGAVVVHVSIIVAVNCFGSLECDT